jgi:hypothetical protein
MIRVLAFLAFTVCSVGAWAEVDPPGRVGRLSLLQGDVTFRNTATGEAEPAVLNWPIASGAALETAARSRAEVRIGSSTIRMDGDSAIEFAVVDDERIHVRIIDGSATVRVKSGEQLADFELVTPQGRVTLHEIGRYRFDHGRTPDTTTLTVHQGSARFESSAGAFAVSAGRRAEIVGRDFRVTAATRDEFDDWNIARDRRDDASRSTRYVSPEMTGYEDLDEHGAWREVADYGPIWVPHAVPADWAPYRTGRWAWVEPWGWTWVDYAPWGFAPFHYGRWVIVGGAWAWAPGVIVARPVYAPALVAWVGRPGWQVTVASGVVPAVGWFPLGPREVFYPGYRCSVHHVRRVNVTHVTNVNQIVSVTHVGNPQYMHRHAPRAVTVTPQNVVASGRPVAPAAIRVQNRQELAAMPVSHAVPDPSITPQRRHAERRDDRDRSGPRPQVERRNTGEQDRTPRATATPPQQQTSEAQKNEARATERSDEPRRMTIPRQEATGERVEREQDRTPRVTPAPPQQQRSEAQKNEARPTERSDEPRRMTIPRQEPPRPMPRAEERPRVATPQSPPTPNASAQQQPPRVIAPQPPPQRQESPRAITPKPAPQPQIQQTRPSGTPHGDDHSRAHVRQPEPQRAAPPQRVEAPPQPPHRSAPQQPPEQRRHEPRAHGRDGPQAEMRGGAPQQR